MKNFLYKTLFVLFILFLYRLGSFITVPAINPITIENYISGSQNDLVNLLNTFTGGSVSRVSILVLGIMPFITAAILIQLFTITIPQFKELKESGEKGQIEINRYIKYLSFFIGFFQSAILSKLIFDIHITEGNIITTDLISYFMIFIISCLTGIFITVFFAEKINEYGYGSGISFVIFANIASGIPILAESVFNSFTYSSNNIPLILFLFSLIFIFSFSIIFENAKKKLPLSSPLNRINNNFLPIKLNVATIMPAIFVFMILSFIFMIQSSASSLLDIDLTIWLQNNIRYNEFLYWLSVFIFIILFSLFYSKTTFETSKIADNLKNTNTYIRGIRPNKPTKNLLNDIRITFSYISGFYLFIVIYIPDKLSDLSGITFLLGGIAILIMANVGYEIKKNFDLNNREKSIKKIKNEIFNKFK